MNISINITAAGLRTTAANKHTDIAYSVLAVRYPAPVSFTYSKSNIHQISFVVCFLLTFRIDRVQMLGSKRRILSDPSDPKFCETEVKLT